MNEIRLFENAEFGKIRVAMNGGEPVFCLADVCKVLDLQASAVLRRLDGDVTSSHPIIDSLGRTQNANFVNEDGLYDVILDSRKPEAKKFRKWVTSEVLPSIRKHGGYIANQEQLTSEQILANAVLLAQRVIADKDNIIKQQQQIITEYEPKVTYHDLILQTPDVLSVSQISKDYGKSAVWMNKKLEELGVQYKQGGVWLLYQKYAELGLTKSKTSVYHDSDGIEHSTLHTYWTQKGRLFIYDLLKQNGELPLIEK